MGSGYGRKSYAYARLKIRPEDLAKVGQLVLDGGRWNGEQLISPAWMEASMQGSKQNPRCGLLWWLIPDHTTFIVDIEHLRALRRSGADSEFVARMATIQGRYGTSDAYAAALQKALGERYWEPYGEARMVTRMDRSAPSTVDLLGTRQTDRMASISSSIRTNDWSQFA